MATKQQKLTTALARKALKWVQEAFGMQQWTFELLIQEKAPDWPGLTSASGAAWIDGPFKKAEVWVSPKGCDENGLDLGQLETLMHEAAHVVLHEAGFDCDQHGEPAEFILTHMGMLMAEAYRRDRKKGRR